VHGGFGAVLFYSDLSRCLGTEQPLYGLQAQGLDGGPIEHKSVEAMATSYIEEMRRVQPRGPYFFGGYSFGGFIAFEMAQQLTTAGEDVALVVLFDTDRHEHRYSLAQRIALRFKALENFRPRERLQNLVRHVWGATQHGLQRVQLANNRALAAYRMRAYPGRITLFRAETVEDRRNGNADDYDWTLFAKGGIEINVVPGEHETIFAPPNVRTLAEKLNDCILTCLTGTIFHSVDLSCQ
jgi:thioesterase domain-containing protein